MRKRIQKKSNNHYKWKSTDKTLWSQSRSNMDGRNEWKCWRSSHTAVFRILPNYKRAYYMLEECIHQWEYNLYPIEWEWLYFANEKWIII